MPRRAKITIVCRGHGCPKPHARTARRRREAALKASLARSLYRAGDRIFITVAVSGLISERAEIRIRAGKIPRVRLL